MVCGANGNTLRGSSDRYPAESITGTVGETTTRQAKHDLEE